MEATLSFLGLFDQSCKSLGIMINSALKYYYLYIWWNWLIPPIFCLTLLAMAIIMGYRCINPGGNHCRS